MPLVPQSFRLATCKTVPMSENHAARLLTVIQTLRKYAASESMTLAEVWSAALQDDDSPIQAVLPHLDYATTQSFLYSQMGPKTKRQGDRLYYRTISARGIEDDMFPRVAEYSKLVWAARLQTSRMAAARVPDAERAVRHERTKTWSNSFFPADHGFHSMPVSKESLISTADLKALKQIAEGWRQIEPLISVVPNLEKRKMLRDEVNALIGTILEDEGLDAALRDAIVQSLHDVLWAIDHWIATGSDGVKAACERLGFQLVSEEDESKTSLKAVWVTLKRIWMFASILSDVGGAYQTVAGIGDHLMLEP